MPSTQRVCDVLTIDPLYKNTCCGLRKDGLPCNNVVAIASRRSAHSILEQCQNLSSESQIFKNNFKTAAKLLLCKRYHQGQQSTIYQTWMDRWEVYERNSDADSGYGSDTDEQSLYSNLLSAVLNSGISHQTIISILQAASAVNATTTTTNINTTASSTTTTNSNTITSNNTTTNNNTTNNSNTATNTHAPHSSSHSHIDTDNQVRPPPTPTHTIFRHTYTECPICMDGYEEDSELWECSACQNRFHKECHELWISTSAVPRCTYCRAAVPDQIRLTTT